MDYYSLTYLLIPAFVFTLTFFFRYLLTIWNKSNDTRFVTFDIAVHAYYIKKLAESKSKRFITIEERFLINEESARPQLIYLLVSLILGYKGFLKYHKLINPFLDAFLNLFLYFLSIYSLTIIGTRENVGFIAGVVSLGYILSPILFFSVNRIAIFGTRHFSYIIVLISFINTILFLLTGNIFNIILAVIFSCLSIFSSQFAFQSIILVQSICSILLWNINPFLFSMLGVGLAFCVAPRWMTVFVKCKYIHLRWYKINLKKGKLNLDWIYNRFAEHIFVYGIVYLFLSFLGFKGIDYTRHDILYFMAVYVLSTLIVCLLVYLPPFRIVGEAIRYLEYSLYFANFILVYCCFVYDLWYLLVLYLIMSFLFSINVIFKLHKENEKNVINSADQLKELINFLKNNNDKIILPIPFKLIYSLLQDCKNRFVYSFWIYGKIRKISRQYAWPLADFDFINNNYQFDWIIATNDARGYDFKDMAKVFENAGFVIYDYRSKLISKSV